jgi:phenylacetate-CoA ligase
MDRILNEFEKMDPQALAELQLERLKKQLNYVYNHSPFYLRKFKEANLIPKDIDAMGDFRNVPFTTKDELRQCNDDFICVENKYIVDIGATTGTTGPPVILPATKKDWDDVVETVMRSLVGLDIGEEDIFQISVAFDQLFSAAPMFDDALKKLGATTLRMGPGNIRRQVEMMQRLGTTAIFSTPDFMLLLGKEAKRLGLDPGKDFRLRMGILVGQNLYTQDWQRNTLNRRIRELWGIEVYSDYGSMEMLASFVECKQHGGHHVFADHFLIEIIDPETGMPVPLGEEGELVATHLTREGIPLVRFKQGDITRIETERCPCGRTTPRIMTVIGRANHMMKIKGVSVYPEQIEEALLGVAGVTAYLIEAYTDMHGMDRIKVRAAVESPQNIAFAEIEKAVKAKARIVPDVIEPITTEEAARIWFSEGTRKPKRFWDKRKKTD